MNGSAKITEKSFNKYALFIGKNFRCGEQLIYNADRKQTARSSNDSF